MISVPFNNYTNFNVGSDNQTQNIMEIQPLVSFGISDDWNLLLRAVMPITTQPGYFTGVGQGTKTGLGNTVLASYFSPKEAFHGITWGIAPAVMLPASSPNYGTKNWGYGLSAVALIQPGNWLVGGGLLTQLWASAGANSAQVNETSLEFFFNYNFPDTGGWYFTSDPIPTYDKRAPSGERWTVPIGAGLGRIFK